ncbi:lysophosphatidic acid receptor 6 [Latimeria chalumnae]|uniref:lysophosphatidic acid receptor 6 n=1 Tax=Latimeria chalumnae TaxID=7897 RepID=UPI0003C1836B|nr:PREDICTED: lysophosphatidic acid receptor 6-like [Latimeria chalumnae]|eukprot:XP_006010166.1 PREDICTED: lysophosphatidic acid receptor 6-like [Latimeria chalumnae]
MDSDNCSSQVNNTVSATNCDNCSSEVNNVVLASLYSVTFVLGLFLNLTALYVFSRCISFRSQTTIYMKNLIVSDLLLILSLPIRVYYYHQKPNLPVLICEITGLVLLVNIYGSIFFLTCISWDRCLAACFPFSHQVKALRKRTKYICLGIWILTIGASIPPYISTKLRNNNVAQCSNCFDNKPIYITKPATLVAMLTVGFGIPLSSLLICSCALMRAVQDSAAAQMDLIDKRKIRNMLITIIVFFLLCFLPYHALLIMHYNSQRSCMLQILYQYTLLLACFNAVLDPLAYYFATETFRKTVIKDGFRKVWGSKSDSMEMPTRSKRVLLEE